MPAFKTIFAALVGAAYLFVCCIWAGMAVVAALGFIYPAMDLFNHIQPILFFGLLLLLGATPAFVRFSGLRPLVLAIAATGFVASSTIYVPEAVGRFLPRSPVAEGAQTYRLMTFNVFGRNERPEDLAAYVTSVSPDIVALQEYNQHMRRAIHPLLSEVYPHFQFCAGGERAFVGLYAKLPFEPLDEDACSSSIMSPDRTARIIVKFDVPDGPDFTLATTHNDWPAPITRQAEQFAALRTALSTVEAPLIVVGDFNSTPWSYALRNFVSDATLTRHTRNLPTFPRLWYYWRGWQEMIAFLPLDHVMTRGGVAIHDIERGEPMGSDHAPLIVTFSVPAQS